MTQNPTDDESTLVQAIAWCYQTSFFLNQCWQSSMMSYGITRPHWVNSLQPSDPICIRHLGQRWFRYLCMALLCCEGITWANAMAALGANDLTSCGIVMPYGIRDLRQLDPEEQTENLHQNMVTLVVCQMAAILFRFQWLTQEWMSR